VRRSTGLGAVQQIALADNPDEPAVLDDRNPADAAIGYQLRQILHRRVRADRDHFGRHHLRGTHRNTSVFIAAISRPLPGPPP
jgi:hypothetical protein